MMEKGMSRRSFLRWSAGAVAGMALFGIAQQSHGYAAEVAGPSVSLSEIPMDPSRLHVSPP